MRVGATLQYRISRFLGRLVTTSAAVLTLGRMPPFVSASALVIMDGRILVVIDPIRHEPVLPGGHLKWRETPEAAVIREVREETGYRIEVERLFGVFSGEEWADEPGIVRVLYVARVSGGTLRSSAEGEAVWMPVTSLSQSDTRDAPILRRLFGL
ncbi:MAG: hypothetical protein NVS2B16_30830 [Chloroflexota bacterium]